jgi:hypothetical protein
MSWLLMRMYYFFKDIIDSKIYTEISNWDYLLISELF